MIDFIKARLDPDTMAKLRQNPALEFKGRFCEKSGEVLEYPRTAKYRSMLFEIRSEDCCLMLGSLHKFARDGRNHDDFSYGDVVAAINDLRTLGIDPEGAKLQNLEFGANLRDLPVSPSTFVHSVLTHRGQAFSKMRGINRQPIGVDLYHQRYGLKIYDKGAQYNLSTQVLRLEVKHTKMHDLNSASIHTLADLTNPNVWPFLCDNLAARIDELLLIEPELRQQDLKPGERRKLDNYENPKFWENLKRENVRKHDHNRRQYRALIAKYLPSPVQSQILEKCKEKMLALSPKPKEKCTKLTGGEKSEVYQINTSYSQLIPSNSTKQVNPADQPSQSTKQIGKVQLHHVV